MMLRRCRSSLGRALDHLALAAQLGVGESTDVSNLFNCGESHILRDSVDVFHLFPITSTRIYNQKYGNVWIIVSTNTI